MKKLLARLKRALAALAAVIIRAMRNCDADWDGQTMPEEWFVDIW